MKIGLIIMYRRRNETSRSIDSRVWLWIDRRILAHKKLFTGCIVTLLIVLLAKNFMYFPGVCIQQPSIITIDESTQNMLPGSSVPFSNNRYLQQYITAISKHFSTKIDRLGKCRYAELSFVYRPLIDDGIPPSNIELTKFYDARTLDSPWVKMTISNWFKPIVRAVFIWNERQFMLDQALMNPARMLGVPVDPNQSLLPLDLQVFNRFLTVYREAEELAIEKFMTAKRNKQPLTICKEISRATIVNNTRQLPADMFWAARRWRALSGGVDKVSEESVGQYIDMTRALLDRRFASLQTEQKYQSVLDLKDVFDIDKYRIK
jgi:hypothetical protein